MPNQAAPARWKSVIAFSIIYFVWGSTFLAIRIGVQEIPPFLFAALRFVTSGLILYLWILLRGEPSPRGRHWASAFALGILIFVLDYGLVFWAEQTIPSGITAVMMATIPMFMSVFEVSFLRTKKFTLRLTLGLLIGFGGVATLMLRSLNLGGTPINTAGALALLIASVSWSLGSILMRRLPLPDSKLASSSIQMLAGGVMLFAVSSILGEFPSFDLSHVSRATWLSLVYLITAGSVVAFTAYVWLIQHHSAIRVGTYAYVNPLVAIVLGYLLAGEPLGARTIVGAACILVSVVMISLLPEPPRNDPSVSKVGRGL